MLIPIVYVGALLGQAFDSQSMIGTPLYIFDKNEIKANLQTIEKPFTRSEYKLVESSATVNNFLDIQGELALKVKSGQFNIKGSGSYLTDTVQRDKTVELLLTVYHETVVETFPSYLKIQDEWQHKDPSEVGTHYIRSIVYGGQLIISYQLKASSSEDLEQIKASVNAHLAVSGSLSGDVEGKLSKIDKEVSGKSSTSIRVYATAGAINQPTTLEETFKLIADYPSKVKEINHGKGDPLKLEIEPLGTLNPKYPDALRQEAANEVLQNAIDKYDDLRNADATLQAWLNTEEPPEELEDDVRDYGNQLQAAKTIMSKAIRTMDLSKDIDVHHFDKAFAQYAEGGLNIPLRYSRNLTRLMNLAHDIKPRWYAYTRAVTLYTYWGSVNCTLPSPEPLSVGLAAALPTGFGSGSNLQCLRINPALGTVNSASLTSAINGLTFVTPNGNTGPLFCARCLLENATSVITVPGRNECPEEMKLEYQGYLATGFDAVSEPICIDNNPITSYENIFPSSDANANVMKPLWIKCDSCVEPKEKYVPCVVCSR